MPINRPPRVDPLTHLYCKAKVDPPTPKHMKSIEDNVSSSSEDDKPMTVAKAGAACTCCLRNPPSRVCMSCKKVSLCISCQTVDRTFFQTFPMRDIESMKVVCGSCSMFQKKLIKNTGTREQLQNMSACINSNLANRTEKQHMFFYEQIMPKKLVDKYPKSTLFHEHFHAFAWKHVINGTSNDKLLQAYHVIKHPSRNLVINNDSVVIAPSNNKDKFKHNHIKWKSMTIQEITSYLKHVSATSTDVIVSALSKERLFITNFIKDISTDDESALVSLLSCFKYLSDSMKSIANGNPTEIMQVEFLNHNYKPIVDIIYQTQSRANHGAVVVEQDNTNNIINNEDIEVDTRDITSTSSSTMFQNINNNMVAVVDDNITLETTPLSFGNNENNNTFFSQNITTDRFVNARRSKITSDCTWNFQVQGDFYHLNMKNKSKEEYHDTLLQFFDLPDDYMFQDQEISAISKIMTTPAHGKAADKVTREFRAKTKHLAEALWRKNCRNCYQQLVGLCSHDLQTCQYMHQNPAAIQCKYCRDVFPINNRFHWEDDCPNPTKLTQQNKHYETNRTSKRQRTS